MAFIADNAAEIAKRLREILESEKRQQETDSASQKTGSIGESHDDFIGMCGLNSVDKWVFG